MSIWRWADWFSQTPASHRLTLGEGNTPLVKSRRIGPEAGLRHLYFKLESSNPTGSYKDRFAAAAVADMLAHGRTLSIGTSSGNTGAAIAAYCAAAGIKCEIVIGEATPSDKIKQMMAYGATLYKVKGFLTDPKVLNQVAEHLEQKCACSDAMLQISAYKYCPSGMAGVQTISYEIHEQFSNPVAGSSNGNRIDHIFVPGGGGGLTLAVARGFAGLVDQEMLAASPAVHCVQPKGNNTIAGPLREGTDRARDCQCTTQISGLQVGSVIDGHDVIGTCRTLGGTGYVVSDDEVWNLQKRVAHEEGIFSEPAGVVALAGALQAVQQCEISAKDTVVCIVTGIGFKDTSSIDRMIIGSECPTITVDQLVAL